MSATSIAAVRTGGLEQPLRARREPALLLAALLWVGGTIHGEAAAGHWQEWPLAAAFFIALAGAQFGLGALLWSRPSRRLLLIGAIGSLLVILLWALTRTIGLPFSPGGGGPESAGALDIAATLDELALAGFALLVLRHGEEALPPRAVLEGILIVLLFGAMTAGGHAH